MAQKTSTNKQPEVKAVKQPKTVKVTTLLKAAVIVLAITAAFFGGYIANQKVNEKIHYEATALVSQLKVNQ